MISEVKLSNNQIIRLTDFAYLCARTVDAKVIFASRPAEIELNISILKVWSVHSCHAFVYFDFVPALQNEAMPLFTKQDYRDFQAALYLGNKVKMKKFKALQAIKRFPQNSMLISEVAKVLFYKKNVQ